MKKLLVTLISIFIPLAILEMSLHSDFIGKQIMVNTPPIEWSQAYIKPNYWPDVLLMGSSLARGAINTDILQQGLKKVGNEIIVGNITVPSDSLSNDYFTLKRILGTCTKCPTTVIIAITDISLKESELEGWRPISEARIEQNFIFSDTSDQDLQDASTLDPAYAEIKKNIDAKKLSRLYFLRRKIKQLILDSISFNKNLRNTVVKTQNADDPGYGYWPYQQKLPDSGDVNSINNYRNYLGTYKIGGSGDFFLRKLIKISHKNNVKIIMLMTPLSDFYQSSFDKEVQMYSDYLNKVSMEYGVLLIDDINLMPTKHELFSDINHLNMYGAEVYTKHLTDELLRQNIKDR